MAQAPPTVLAFNAGDIKEGPCMEISLSLLNVNQFLQTPSTPLALTFRRRPVSVTETVAGMGESAEGRCKREGERASAWFVRVVVCFWFSDCRCA